MVLRGGGAEAVVVAVGVAVAEVAVEARAEAEAGVRPVHRHHFVLQLTSLKLMNSSGS